MAHRTIDLTHIKKSETIQFLYAQTPIPASFLGRVCYAKNGVEQPLGLRIDRSKGFLEGDFPSDLSKDEEQFIIGATKNIMAIVFSNP